MKNLIQLIQNSNKIVLSTHRQCDGDGLGAQIALYHALKKINKDVQIINVDSTPKKYRFLNPDTLIKYFENNPAPIPNHDLCMIFDTNDSRLLEPLYTEIQKSCKHISFIDHHPLLQKGPVLTQEILRDSIIDTDAASTGELTFNIIKELKIPLDKTIARALYTSITFDTQFYKFIRNSPQSHLIAAELLNYDINPEEIHRFMFSNQTVSKMAFLGKALSSIEYHFNGKLAFLKIYDTDLTSHNLDMDDSRDVIDLVMTIENLEAAILIREDAPEKYKISLRSKGKIEVLTSAESIGGGGHSFASGAYYFGPIANLKNQLLQDLTQKLKAI